MTPPEVSDLSQRVDLEALLAYRLAVARRTREVVAGLDDAWLQTSMTDDEAMALRAMGAFGEHAGWVGDLWAPKPRMWFLWLATGHSTSTGARRWWCGPSPGARWGSELVAVPEAVTDVRPALGARRGVLHRSRAMRGSWRSCPTRRAAGSSTDTSSSRRMRVSGCAQPPARSLRALEQYLDEA